MLNTDDLRSRLKDLTGTEAVVDLGLVHQGRIGYADCKVATGIERWQGMYFVWISVVHQKNRAGRHTSIIRWPYSRSSAKDLDHVLADIRVIENAVAGPSLADHRGWFGRGFDRLIGREHIGEYRLTSPLQSEPLYGGKVKATIVRMGGQLEVSLVEGRSAGVIILAQFPHAACARLRHALATYAADP